MEARTCPFCGAELRADVMRGLCPKCVLKGATAEEEEQLPQEVIYFYEPLRAVCLSCDPLTKALRSYVDLWRK